MKATILVILAILGIQLDYEIGIHHIIGGYVVGVACALLLLTAYVGIKNVPKRVVTKKKGKLEIQDGFVFLVVYSVVMGGIYHLGTLNG